MVARFREQPSARRRRAPSGPVKLRRCVVEDWCNPVDEDVERVVDDSGGDVSFAFMVVARGRWRAARDDWLDARGLTRADDLASFGGPVFRDEAKLLAARTKSLRR